MTRSTMTVIERQQKTVVILDLSGKIVIGEGEVVLRERVNALLENQQRHILRCIRRVTVLLNELRKLFKAVGATSSLAAVRSMPSFRLTRGVYPSAANLVMSGHRLRVPPAANSPARTSMLRPKRRATIRAKPAISTSSVVPMW